MGGCDRIGVLRGGRSVRVCTSVVHAFSESCEDVPHAAVKEKGLSEATCERCVAWLWVNLDKSIPCALSLVISFAGTQIIGVGLRSFLPLLFQGVNLRCLHSSLLLA